MSHGHLTTHRKATVEHVLATRYIQLSSLTLILYDHLLTFDKEVELVWRGASPKSWPRIVFLLARYACPIALIINTYPILGPRTDSNNVRTGWLFFHGWAGFIFFAGIQVIAQMRLWAMYRSRLLLSIMTVFIFLALIGMAILEGLGYSNVRVTSLPVVNLPNLRICGPAESLPHYIYGFWIPPLAVEFISLILVSYKAVMYYQGNAHRDWAGSRLMSSLIRHSVFYFIVVLSLYLGNLYIWAKLPIDAFETIIPLTYALPSIAGNRMLLSLRSVFYEKYAELPGRKDTIGLTTFNAERGLTVHIDNPLKEFESFFGEHH